MGSVPHSDFQHIGTVNTEWLFTEWQRENQERWKKPWSHHNCGNIANFNDNFRHPLKFSNCFSSNPTENNNQRSLLFHVLQNTYNKVIYSLWWCNWNDGHTLLCTAFNGIFTLAITMPKKMAIFCVTPHLATFQLFMPDERCNWECQIPSRLLDRSIETLFI